MRESQKDNIRKERLLDQDMDNRIREALSLQADVMESRKNWLPIRKRRCEAAFYHK